MKEKLHDKIKRGALYFTDTSIDFRIRLFYMLALGGIGTSIVTLIISVLTSLWVITGICIMLIFISSFLIWFIGRAKNRQQVYIITVVLIFMIVFPLIFIFSGGHRGGNPAMFMFAVMFTVLMLKGKKAHIFSMFEILEYSIICIISYYFIDFVPSYESEFQIMCDIVIFFSITSIVCGVTLYYHLSEYDKQLELLNEKNKELERYDASRSTFLTTVSHEIKNPLAAISLHSGDTLELLDETPLDYQLVRENQEIIIDMVKRMDKILMDLKDTVAIEQGRLSLTLYPMETKQLIEETIDFYYTDKNNNGNKIHLELEDNLPPIMADYSRIVQVLTNLLDNSIRYTKNGEIVISLSRRDNEQLICVSDTGIGMEKALKIKVFKGYVSTSEDYWRHGIGLYVCHQIVSAHNGRIWIDSTLGEGTSVFFTLPYTEDRDEQ